MNLVITFHCATCLHMNRQYLGEDGYELRVSTFDSFTEAWNHQYENRDHELLLEITQQEAE